MSQLVERLCEVVQSEGWEVKRDKRAMRYGDLISAFMRTISQADLVIVILSDKYLRSPYCMTELHYVFQQSLGEKEDFLRRVIPLKLEDACTLNLEGRQAYAEYWDQELKKWNQKLGGLSLSEMLVRLSSEDWARFKAIQEWHLRVVDMLGFLEDKLELRGAGRVDCRDLPGEKPDTPAVPEDAWQKSAARSRPMTRQSGRAWTRRRSMHLISGYGSLVVIRAGSVVVGIFPANRIQKRDLRGGRLPSFASVTSRFKPVFRFIGCRSGRQRS